ncbi:hypothetical protein SG34_019320 [Thalassomonas viridans]|uniref:Uncharacterized protein n=1 Tax=Thalassomonas viridans TaxID=137584 RepID=A0AAE9YYZ1_9GAMM|nr:hypothetical protein [Thalassomonas viridans]WDE03528.1 hypothetical protein SG34_019320 [Thalassomonas viridans]
MLATMQVVNSNSINPSFTRVNRPTQAQQEQVRSSAQLERAEEQTRNSAQQSGRFDVNEQAIALLEQEAGQQTGQGLGQQSAGQESGQGAQLQLFADSSDNTQGAGTTAYDRPSSQNLNAVAAYQSVNNIAQRDNVQQLFGVDLFA